MLIYFIGFITAAILEVILIRNDIKNGYMIDYGAASFFPIFSWVSVLLIVFNKEDRKVLKDFISKKW